MKRAKIVLGVVAVLGIVGASFAFKARSSQYIYKATTTAPTTLCTSQSFGLTTTVAGAPNSFTTIGTTNPALPCAILTVRPGL